MQRTMGCKGRLYPTKEQARQINQTMGCCRYVYNHIHSDQGTQYTSFGYRHLLAEHNVIQSMSRAWNPRDNAVMESFFGRFKDTLRRHFYSSSQDDLYDVVAKCIENQKTV